MKSVEKKPEIKKCECGSNCINTTNKDHHFCFHCGKSLTNEQPKKGVGNLGKPLNSMKHKLSDYGVPGDDNSREYAKEQSPVEWFYRNVFAGSLTSFGVLKRDQELLKQAKEMEEEIIKKEREEAYKNGYENGQMDAFTK